MSQHKAIDDLMNTLQIMQVHSGVTRSVVEQLFVHLIKNNVITEEDRAVIFTKALQDGGVLPNSTIRNPSHDTKS